MELYQPILPEQSGSDSPESELWLKFKGGDKRALSHIYTRYFNKLYNYGSRISPDTGLVEDSIQDLFVAFWHKREDLTDVRNIKSYLYKCLRRKIVYKLSLKTRQNVTDDLRHFEIELCDKSHYLNQEINREIRLQLSRLVQNLLPKQKEAIFLIYYDELSYEEVASVMNLKVKTVYNLIHLAISRLRESKDSLNYSSLFSLLF